MGYQPSFTVPVMEDTLICAMVMLFYFNLNNVKVMFSISCLTCNLLLQMFCPETPQVFFFLHLQDFLTHIFSLAHTEAKLRKPYQLFSFAKLLLILHFISNFSSVLFLKLSTVCRFVATFIQVCLSCKDVLFVSPQLQALA